MSHLSLPVPSVPASQNFHGRVPPSRPRLNLRLAAPDDLEPLYQLVNDAYHPPASETGYQGWTNENRLVYGLRIQKDRLEAQLAKGAPILVAEWIPGSSAGNPRLLACIQLTPGGNACDIGMFAVAPQLQNRGLGRWLLVQAEQLGHRAWHNHVFRMWVVAGRPELLAFYQRCGYIPGGQALLYRDLPDAGQAATDDLQVLELVKPV